MIIIETRLGLQGAPCSLHGLGLAAPELPAHSGFSPEETALRDVTVDSRGDRIHDGSRFMLLCSVSVAIVVAAFRSKEPCQLSAPVTSNGDVTPCQAQSPGNTAGTVLGFSSVFQIAPSACVLCVSCFTLFLCLCSANDVLGF